MRDTCDPGVGERLLDGGALGGVHRQELLHQVLSQRESESARENEREESRVGGEAGERQTDRQTQAHRHTFTRIQVP